MVFCLFFLFAYLGQIQAQLNLTKQDLFAEVDRITDIADIDGDGDMDVFARNAIWRNDGNNGFTEEVFNGANLQVADIDGDGALDLVGTQAISTGQGFRIVWWKNGDANQMTTIETISSLFGYGLNNLFVIDVDGNGTIDIVSNTFENFPNGSSTLSTYTIARHMNNGAGQFTNVEIELSGVAKNIFVADLNKDGDADYISTTSSYNQFADMYSATISSHLNNGGTFSTTQMDFRTGSTFSSVSYGSIHVANLNNVGSCEVLTGDDFTIWKSLGSNPARNLVDPTGFTTLSTGDFNGDGYLDLVFSNGTFLAIRYALVIDDTYTGEYNELELIDPNNYAFVEVIDFDGDGDLDMKIMRFLVQLAQQAM